MRRRHLWRRLLALSSRTRLLLPHHRCVDAWGARCVADNIGMRNALDLYANLRPSLSSGVNVHLPHTHTREFRTYSDTQQSKPNVDLLIVRENTECLYVKKERLYVEVRVSHCPRKNAAHRHSAERSQAGHCGASHHREGLQEDR